MANRTDKISGLFLVFLVTGMTGFSAQAQECPPPIVLNFDLASERLKAQQARFTVFFSDIEVQSGQVVSIRADGKLSVPGAYACNTTPSGVKNGCRRRRLVPNVPVLGLLCRIDNGSNSAPWKYCGTEARRESNRKGKLQFAINDRNQADIGGFFLISVDVDGEVKAALVPPKKTASGPLEWTDAPHASVPIATLVDERILTYAARNYEPPQGPLCQVAMSYALPQDCEISQQMLLNRGNNQGVRYDEECKDLRKSCESTGWSSSRKCVMAVQCQDKAIASLAQARRDGRLKKLDLNKFISLYEEAVWGKLDPALKTARQLYLDYPDRFMDPEFSSYLSGQIEEIVRALKNDRKMKMPSEAEYLTDSNLEKGTLLQRIADIVWNKLGVSTLTIDFDPEKEDFSGNKTEQPIGEICGEPMVVEGYYKHGLKHGLKKNSLTLKMTNMALIVKKKKQLGNVEKPYQSVRDTHIATLLHEAFHHYQERLIEGQKNGALSRKDQQYQQTHIQMHIVAINQRSYQPPTEPIDPLLRRLAPLILYLRRVVGSDCDTYLAYRQQPKERLAIEFSEEVRKRWLE